MMKPLRQSYWKLFQATARKVWLPGIAFEAMNRLHSVEEWRGLIALACQQRTLSMLWRAVDAYHRQSGKVPLEVLDVATERVKRFQFYRQQLSQIAVELSQHFSDRTGSRYP